MLRYLVGFMLVLMPLATLAADDDGPTFVESIDYTLEQPFGGYATVASFSQYLQLLYQFALGIVGIIAVVLIMFGGLRWVAAAGNESAIGEAKEIIVSAVTGLAIALLSYMILGFLNPETLKLNFSVQNIPIGAFNGIDISELKKCTEAPFTGNTCIVSGSNTSKNCDELVCSEIGLYNQEYCRGIACSDSTKCYPTPSEPTKSYTCQPPACGKWVESCVTNFESSRQHSGESEDELRQKCNCGYYKTTLMQVVAESTDPWTYDADERSYFSQFCNEDRSNADWVQFWTDAGEAEAANKLIWNCATAEYNPAGMNCKYEQSAAGLSACTAP